MEREIEFELNKLQNDYFHAYDEALHFKIKYEEYQNKVDKIKDIMREKVQLLYQVNPESEYELEPGIML